jgi:hypothetical protein
VDNLTFFFGNALSAFVFLHTIKLFCMKKAKSTHSTLESKLKTYSTVAAGVIAAGSSVNAQIVYTDIDPDVMLSDSSFYIDLDNNDTADFAIVHINYSYGSTSFLNLVGLQALRNNEVLGDTIVSATYSYVSFLPAVLNADDDIDASKEVWYNSYYGMMYYNGVYGSFNFTGGNWGNASDKYLGLRFKIDNKWHYGWARVDITANGSAFIVKDYAYESYPEKHILAGKQVSVIPPEDNKMIQVFSANQKLFIHTNGAQIEGNVAHIYNTVGQKMKDVKLDVGKNIISINDLSKGIYIVNLAVNGQTVSRKFIKR